MRQVLAFLAAIILFTSFSTGTGLAQAPAAKPAFDVADVHIRTRSSNPNPAVTGGILRGGRYDLRNATMVDLIATAYGVNAEAIVGGPNWLERTRFDIIAKAPQTTSPDNIKLMLQGLLANRFALALKNETRDIPGFALTVAPGRHKMKEAAPGGSGSCQPVQQTPEPGTIAYAMAQCRGITMAAFATQLRFMAGAYIERTLTDATGLEGTWDFDLKWTSRALLAQAGSDGIPMPDALEKQLGLQMVARGISQPVVVVTSVNEHPTPNPSGVAENIPSPPPAEFDVADIKLSPPDAKITTGQLQPGGRLNFQNIPLLQLIQIAWDINDPERIIAPSWLADTRVTILARTSETALGGSADGMAIDIDDVRLMMQSLLKQRFKMVVHGEDRPLTAYTLMADGAPKMKKADPANRTSCKNGPGASGRDPRNNNPILSRLVTCVNTSMADFAADLPRLAPGYIRTSVVDATGIEGSFDFTFNFTPAGVGGIPAGGRDGGGGGGAPSLAPSSDPTGAMTLFDALKRQLGVKLETQKRPMPVLVIDSMERAPIDN